eukprot:scaffold4183_cov137-Cylindrotheca_fusiformis.AAC.6
MFEVERVIRPVVAKVIWLVDSCDFFSPPRAHGRTTIPEPQSRPKIYFSHNQFLNANLASSTPFTIHLTLPTTKQCPSLVLTMNKSTIFLTPSRIRSRTRAPLAVSVRAHTSSSNDQLHGLESREMRQGKTSFNETFFSISKSMLGNGGISKAVQRNYRFLSSSSAPIDNVGSMRPSSTHRRSGVRNVAVVAHVDHGKTTLVDQLLKACSSDQQSEDRLLDSGELEKERGITISSKVTRCDYKDTVINIVDTPGKIFGKQRLGYLVSSGHADFCGEVDRVLSLVDGVCLVVDAAEGPMAQTKYVLGRALSLGKNPIVVINKADRADGLTRIESGETESELLDLFDNLGATDEQMEYTTLYASARNGWVTDDQVVGFGIANGSYDMPGEQFGMHLLLDHILDHIVEPSVESFDDDINGETAIPGESFAHDKFSLAAVTVGYDSYLGRTCTGRITSGSISLGDEVIVLKAASNTSSKGTDPKELPETSTISGIFVNRGISRTPLEPPVAYAGDILTLAGVPDSIAVGDTLTKSSDPVDEPLESLPLSPPILAMEFGANDGPLSGSEGSEVTPTKIRNRLIAETDNNVTLTVEKSKNSDKTTVFARGELQLGILIEQMRREGYELVISPPKVMTKIAEDEKTLLEPFEEVTVDVDTEYSGYIVSALTGDRKGVLLDMFDDASGGKTRLRLEVPSRGLLGFHSEAATTTRGSAIVNHCFLEDRKHVGQLGDGLERGKLISSESGKASHYALASLAARGVLFIEPGHLVYPGMIIGENAKQGDLEVNPVRAKAATNMRTQNKDERVNLQPAKKMSVEELLGYMAPDEMLEVTPTSVRLRKAELDPVERRKSSRIKKQQQDALKMRRKQ